MSEGTGAGISKVVNPFKPVSGVGLTAFVHGDTSRQGLITSITFCGGVRTTVVMKSIAFVPLCLISHSRSIVLKPSRGSGQPDSVRNGLSFDVVRVGKLLIPVAQSKTIGTAAVPVPDFKPSSAFGGGMPPARTGGGGWSPGEPGP